MNEYLRRIDERNYLTEREHREFLDRLNKDLEDYEELKKFLYGTIKQKKEDTEKDLKMIMSDNNKRLLLVGEINAYTDILCLIESSGVLNENN